MKGGKSMQGTGEKIGNIESREALERKRQTGKAIIACAISLIATVAFLIGLVLDFGIVNNFIFAAYAVSLGAMGKMLFKLLTVGEFKSEG